MSSQYALFEKYLFEGSKILDCGCGSGRDSKHFLDAGYNVVAIDGSATLCKKASEYTGLEVVNTIFQDISFNNEFDGVWASASLLHVPSDELPSVLKKIKNSLVNKGILYVSFKYGEFEGERNGRFYLDLNEESFNRIITAVGGFEIKEVFISEDVRPAKESERGVVDIETLTQTNQMLIDTLDEVMQIQTEGRTKRAEAEKELVRIEDEMKSKLIEVSNTVRQ